MKKILDFLKFIIDFIFILSEVFLITVTLVLGLSNFFDFQILNMDILDIFILMIKLSTPFIISYFELAKDKIVVDNWKWWDHFGFLIVIYVSVAYVIKLEGLEQKILVYSFLCYLLCGLLKAMIRNKLIFIIAVASLAYGFIDDDVNFSILLTLFTFLMGSLDINEVKKILEINELDDYIFVKYKLYGIIAIISTCFTSIFGEKLLEKLILVLDFKLDSIQEIFIKGGLRLIFSLIIFQIIINILEEYKERIKDDRESSAEGNSK